MAAMGEVHVDDDYISGMVKENTVWDVYNNEAKKVDTELVKDWKDSLNFLLVFVSTHTAFPDHSNTHIGGHFRCGTDSIYHRKQKATGTRPNRPSRRCRHSIPEQWWKLFGYTSRKATIRSILHGGFNQLLAFC